MQELTNFKDEFEMKKVFSIPLIAVLGLINISLSAQVGINTATPTEIYDIDGTVRVRSIPTIGTANSIYTTGTNTQSGTAPTQTFNGSNIVYTDANGVLGRSTTTTANLIPNNATTGFNTTNTSTAMFVIKRFAVPDFPNAGYDTGMDLTRWEPVMSNIMFTFTNGIALTSVYNTGGRVSYRLQATGTTWKIIGDVNGVEENSFVDVLFINKTFAAADTRTN